MQTANSKQPILLLLGGASVHYKLVEAAHELGLYVIVTDYLDFKDSPAKQIADKHYRIDINDIDAIVEMCRNECVDAVLASHLDPCQRPYQKICERLSLPCLGTKEQFFLLTDKSAFKKLCRENGVDIVPEFSKKDIEESNAEYPVFVKPVDSRGSRGQFICYSQEETLIAIESAKKEASDGNVIIEKYMKGAEEIQVTYFFIRGKAYLVRTTDSYRGREEDKLERVVIYSLSPSKHTDEYLKTAHNNVVSMLKHIGIHDGPVMMQGFYDNGKFRFFDPGLRFPGTDYERIYKKVFGIDLLKLMIDYACTGTMPNTELPEDSVYLKGKRAVVFFPTVCAGTIHTLEGIDAIKHEEAVVSYLARHSAGDSVDFTFNVNQRLSEIDLLADNDSEMCMVLKRIIKSYRVLDSYGKNMLWGIPEYPYAKNKYSRKIMFLSQKDLISAGCFDMLSVIDVCEKTLNNYAHGNIIFPEKVSVVFDESTQERINCLPAGLKSEKVYGAKWVSVFPDNPHRYGVPNLSAVVILSELRTGFPIAFIEGTMLSNMRTAAMSALAAKYLACENPEVIGFIGTGEQAKSHFLAMKAMFPSLRVCRVSSRTSEREREFISQMKNFCPDMELIACNGVYKDAVIDADIIVTAISGQEKILRADWIKEGKVFYTHVGGLEDDFGVAERASKIVCDDWNVVKHRTQTISRMYHQNLLHDDDIYADLYEIVSGQKKGREKKDGLIYYNGVGLSYIDVAVANWAYHKAKSKGYGIELELTDRSVYE